MSSCFNWAKFLMFYVTVNEKEFFYRACLLVFWFYRHNPTHPSGSLSLCFTSEQVLHPYPCTLQDYAESCWKLSLKTIRNVSSQCHQKHRHYRSHIFFMPSAHEETRGKDSGMSAAMSSVSFTLGVSAPFALLHPQGGMPSWSTQLFSPVIFGTQVFAISWKLPRDTLHRFIHSDWIADISSPLTYSRGQY